MIPPRFHGAWRRVSVALDGGPPHEPAQVVWVQAGTAFADVRVPLDGAVDAAVSFAGTTRWEEPDLVWDHQLDLTGGSTEDRGTVWWTGGDLVERGSFLVDGELVPYVEVWRRLAGSTGPALSMVRADGHGLLVRAGDHGLTVTDDRPTGAYRACYRSRDGASGRWPTVLTLGPGAEELPAPPLCGDDMPAGWQLLDFELTPALGFC